MKGKIEVAANVIVIVFAVVVGSVVLKDRLSPGTPEPVKAGDKLPNLDGWDWGAHDLRNCMFTKSCFLVHLPCIAVPRLNAREFGVGALIANTRGTHVI